jgi:hypothetical protein
MTSPGYYDKHGCFSRAVDTDWDSSRRAVVLSKFFATHQAWIWHCIQQRIEQHSSSNSNNNCNSTTATLLSSLPGDGADHPDHLRDEGDVLGCLPRDASSLHATSDVVRLAFACSVFVRRAMYQASRAHHATSSSPFFAGFYELFRGSVEVIDTKDEWFTNMNHHTFVVVWITD